MQLYGSFAGTETSLSTRNLSANETILSGDIGTAGDSTDNTHHIISCSGSVTDSNTTINGVTIRDANAIASYGAGIYYATNTDGVISALTMRHCRLTHNRASYGGGAIYCRAFSSQITLTIDSCMFDYNTSDSERFLCKD